MFEESTTKSNPSKPSKARKPESNPRIHWTDLEHGILAAEGARLQALDPSLTYFQALKDAQEVLPKNRRRPFQSSMSTHDRKWWTKAMANGARILKRNGAVKPPTQVIIPEVARPVTSISSRLDTIEVLLVQLEENQQQIARDVAYLLKLWS